MNRNDYGLSIGGPIIIPKLSNGRNRTFLRRSPVGGGWFGGISGILFTAGKLTFQIGDLLFRIGHLFPQPFDLLAEAFVLSPQFVRRQ